MNPLTTSSLQTITLGGGCFWCLDAAYRRVRGIRRVESGYSNGQSHRPSYEQVCTGSTGCVEVVQLDFDPVDITLREVLEIFFTLHDPTTRNRQGHDIGTQYRSGVYWHEAAQRPVIEAVMGEIGQLLQPRVIVTEVEPLAHYWPAEDYHQRYYEHHPEQGYCAAVIEPKLAKLRRLHASRLLL